MDDVLLRYYERELQYLRETGGEFARHFPKIAGRLGIENYACADPYVERLLEGFSFIAARIQLKIDAEFPKFTNHLLELIYPQYLAPTPSMAIVRIEPDLSQSGLVSGIPVPRGSALRSLLGKNEQTSCEFRTAHDLTLWPLEIVSAGYSAHVGEINGIAPVCGESVKACLRLQLRVTGDCDFSELALDSLPLFLRGSDALPGRIAEHVFSNAAGLMAMPARNRPEWHEMMPKSCIRQLGFAPEEALLPSSARAFDGYRLLHEYFVFPQRYLFVELGGLREAVKQCGERLIDIVILLNRHEAAFEQEISVENFALFCTPAINLFPRRTDRVHLAAEHFEYHVVPDRTRPTDFEIHHLSSVKGHGVGNDAGVVFKPFYAACDSAEVGHPHAYYQISRIQRPFSGGQQRGASRSGYAGSEVFISLSDSDAAPFPGSLRQLGIEAMCTNRDLVLNMPIGVGNTDFTLESSAPVRRVRCLAGPTAPLPSRANGETAWRLVSHLSLNYLSLVDTESDASGANALRDLLRLYVPETDGAARRQIDGLRSVSVRPIVRRMPIDGPICHARGLQVTLALDDDAFEGMGVFLLGAVLERFLAKYVTLNSFTETVLRSAKRGEIFRWPARIGRCELI